MHIYYFLKESFGLYPPCVSHVHLLREAGARVTVIAGACPERIALGFQSANIDLRIVGNDRSISGMAGKALSYAGFRTRAISAVGSRLENEDTAVWFGTADTAMALWGSFRRQPKGASILELYDTNSTYRRSLKCILPELDVVVACERTRAEIMQSWFQLDRLPLVVVNKPHDHPGQRRMPSTADSTAKAIQQMTQPKSLLYQGMIAPDRTLVPLVEALNRMDDARWWLYLIGPVQGDVLSRVEQKYERTVYLGNHTPPTHLEVTSHAHIGVAYYDRSSLNNIFCAPNKIYEYTGFGIPVLANDVAGLRFTIGANGAGVCVDFGDPDALVDGIRTIDSNYGLYAKRARFFFDSAENLSVIKTALGRLVASKA